METLIGAAIFCQMTSQHQCMFLNGTITKAKAFFSVAMHIKRSYLENWSVGMMMSVNLE